MPDFEKTISNLIELNDAIQRRVNDADDAYGFVAINLKYFETIKDAIALLKAQRPRLMSLQEVLVSSGAIWLEFEAEEGGYYRYGYAFVSCANEHMVEFIVRDGYRPLIQFPRADYLKYWRCWTTQPTQEQREMVKWDG